MEVLVAQTDGSSGHLVDVVIDFLVFHRVLVPGDVVLLHVACDQGNELVALFAFRHLHGFLDEQLDGTPVMPVADFAAGIGDAVRLHVQVVRTDNLIGVVDVQLEVRHDGEVVPQLVLEVGDFAQLGEHASHDVDDGVGTALTFCTVFDGQRMVDHVLHAPSVLRKRHFLTLGVIIVFLIHNSLVEKRGKRGETGQSVSRECPSHSSFFGLEATNSFR